MPAPHILVASSTIALVFIAVSIHYEAFLALRTHLRNSRRSPRYRLLILMLSLVTVHVVQIWLFGLLAFGLITWYSAGALVGYPVQLLDFIYMSAVTYSTVGYGDLEPIGPVRFLYGTEALIGFSLLTWSASMTFSEVQSQWNQQ